VCSMSRSIQASARLHEWQEDALEAIKENVNIEGSDAGTDTSITPVLKTASCQIFKETVNISRTLERVKKYGRASEMNYQTMKRKLALVRDEESAVTGAPNGVGRQVGVSTDPRELPSIYSQTYLGDTGNEVATTNVIYATADNLVGGVDITSTEQLETNLVTCLQHVYENGGNPSVIVTDTATVGYFPSFALSAGRNVDVVGGDLYNFVDVYRSQYGSCDVMSSRSMNNVAAEKAILVLDPEYLATPILDPTHDYALAKDGDRERREIVRESTFAVLNERAVGYVDAIPLTLTTGV
jgi:hypothetical protein